MEVQVFRAVLESTGLAEDAPGPRGMSAQNRRRVVHRIPRDDPARPLVVVPSNLAPRVDAVDTVARRIAQRSGEGTARLYFHERATTGADGRTVFVLLMPRTSNAAILAAVAPTAIFAVRAGIAGERRLGRRFVCSTTAGTGGADDFDCCDDVIFVIAINNGDVKHFHRGFGKYGAALYRRLSIHAVLLNGYYCCRHEIDRLWMDVNAILLYFMPAVYSLY